jgi:class 3 adenylate cyclase
MGCVSLSATSSESFPTAPDETRGQKRFAYATTIKPPATLFEHAPSRANRAPDDSAFAGLGGAPSSGGAKPPPPPAESGDELVVLRGFDVADHRRIFSASLKNFRVGAPKRGRTSSVDLTPAGNKALRRLGRHGRTHSSASVASTASVPLRPLTGADLPPLDLLPPPARNKAPTGNGAPGAGGAGGAGAGGGGWGSGSATPSAAGTPPVLALAEAPLGDPSSAPAAEPRHDVFSRRSSFLDARAAAAASAGTTAAGAAGPGDKSPALGAWCEPPALDLTQRLLGSGVGGPRLAAAVALSALESANLFEHLQCALLIVNGRGEVVSANHAAYSLFEINGSEKPLRDTRLQWLLGGFPDQPLRAKLQPGLWVKDRFCDPQLLSALAAAASALAKRDLALNQQPHPARTRFLEWTAWRLDRPDARALSPQPQPIVDNAPGAGPDDAENKEDAAAARLAVLVRDATEEELLRAEVRRLERDKDEVIRRAVACRQLRERMQMKRGYHIKLHRTALIGFIDVKGSTTYNKTNVRALVDYTDQVRRWAGDVDKLRGDDEEILKLEMVGDAFVFAFALFDPLLMANFSPLAPPDPDPPAASAEGAKPSAAEGAPAAEAATAEGAPRGRAVGGVGRSGTATPQTPMSPMSLSAAKAPRLRTAPSQSGLPLGAGGQSSAPHSVLNAPSASAAGLSGELLFPLAEAKSGMDAYEERVGRAVAKACRFLDRVMRASLARHGFQLRSALHLGIATTSCVGNDMPKLTTIGAPADLASRLQNHGSPGSIHMTAALAHRYLDDTNTFSIGLTTATTLHNCGTLDTCLVSVATK